MRSFRHNEERQTGSSIPLRPIFISSNATSAQSSIGKPYRRSWPIQTINLMLNSFFVRAQPGIQPFEVGGEEEACGVGHPLLGAAGTRNILSRNAWRKKPSVLRR